MNRNIRQTLLAPAALLLAVTLGLAGCTQGEDALPGADGNDGARILNINVGPKQGFTSGNADSNAPATRSTVNEDTGAMSWEEGDRIFLHVTYTGASAKGYTMVRNAASAWDFYKGYVGTHDKDGNAIDLSGLTSFSGIPVSMGATAITRIIAYHTDNDTYPSFNDTMVLKEGGSCDQLRQVIDNPDMNADITLALTHASVARLYFPGGLTPGKKYYPEGLMSIMQMGINQPMATVVSDNFSFTAAPDGSLAICIGDDTATGSQTVILKEKDDDDDDTNDKVVYTATFNIAFGSSYQCIIPAAGGVRPDSRPDLLIPDPVVPGNKVYAMNGYFFTAADLQTGQYDMGKDHVWSTNPDATQIDNDPCAGHGSWRMPTMKDFQRLFFPDGTGLTNDGTASVDMEWTQDGGRKHAYLGFDSPAGTLFNETFGDTDYWSSDVVAGDNSKVWVVFYGCNVADVTYNQADKSAKKKIRCIQEQ